MPLILAACAGSTFAAPPVYTATVVARSGDVVNGTSSTIANSQNFPPFGSLGIQGVAINNSGNWALRIDTRHNTTIGNTVHKAVLLTQTPQGPFTPYIIQGTPGYLSVPTSTAIASEFYAHATNNAGNSVFAIQWGPDDFFGPTGTGVFWNTSKVVFLENDLVDIVGVDAGATWGPVTSQIAIAFNDANQLMVATTINELGQPRRAIVRFQLDATGNVLGKTLIAKEGGPISGGTGNWSVIALGGTTAAMNAAGQIAFSGTTTTGVDGVYSTAVGSGGFVAVAGGASPIPGVSWGSLVGAPLDINASGAVAFRGRTSDTTSTYTESSPDAGDVFDSEDHTYGNGPLTRINGALINDHDVDFYRITVTDANAFSATTVPDPGSGFAGAAFDTVLTLVADPGENISANAGGRTQSDNVSTTVLQSTITGGSGRAVSGKSYYLAISTPKSRIGKRVWHYATNTYPVVDGWQSDPAALAIGGGQVHWPDPSAGAIRRISTSGVAQPDVAVPAVTTPIAIDTVNSRIYWAESNRIRRSNLDGSNAEDIVGGTAPATYSASSCTGLAVDAVRGRIYWTRSIFGEINSADLDGQNQTRVIQDSLNGSDVFPGIDPTGTFAPNAIAIDTSAGLTGKIYWVNPVQNSIERCNISPIGTGRTTVVANAGVVWGSGIAIDSSAGKVYWASTTLGKVRRANLDGSGAEDVSVSPLPHGLALDGAGNVWWSNTLDRVIRRASIAGALPAAATDVASAGVDVGERGPDGPARPYSGFLSSFTRVGSPVASTLPYQIRLTGASFQYEQTILAKNNQKVAAVGDSVPGIAGSVICIVAQSGTPVRMDDLGNVMWSGISYPVIANNAPAAGIFYNQDSLIRYGEVPTGGASGDQRFTYLLSGAQSIDLSANGQYAMIAMNMLAPPYSFSQFDNAVRFQFTLPPSCPADFNASGTLTVQDIFDFLNAWFAGTPNADFNGAGGISVQDIFDFLNVWFAGCP